MADDFGGAALGDDAGDAWRARHLVIDTATEALSLALFEDDICIAQSHEIIGRGHAEQLLPRIADLPDGGRAARIAVDTGPGSFTGLRVGIAAARALGFAWGASIEGYGSLSLLAHMAHPLHEGKGPIAVIITGGHGELFWQTFDAASLSALTQPRSTAIANLAAQLDCPIFYGSGAAALVAARGAGRAVPLHPQASAFMALSAAERNQSSSPFYGRGADAVPLARAEIA